MIKIYNSITNKIEDFHPIKPGEVMMYVCGPTVYGPLHIGNTRPVVFFDTVHRFFDYMGFKVTYASNFTDIDDKIIHQASLEGVSETTISERYIKETLDLYKSLNCLSLSSMPKVTENIQEIIVFIQELIAQDGAYVVDGDVYFHVDKVKNYGLLSGQSLDKLIQGARVEENEKKKHPADFTLWKKTDTGIRYPSPWGEGRPGWHTECVVMVEQLFGGMIDIHGGGIDLKFPHHENEIAQSECLHHHPIAKHWMHNGRIDLSGEKMSKSIGNVVWAKDLIAEIGYRVYRYMILNVPYRQPMLYKNELAIQATIDFEKIDRAYVSLHRKLEINFDTLDTKEVIDQDLVNIKNSFIDAMKDDFNTANAITAMFQLVKWINKALRDSNTPVSFFMEAKGLLYDMMWVFGIENSLVPLSSEDKLLVRQWEEARTNKDFDLADKYRKMMQEKDIQL